MSRQAGSNRVPLRIVMRLAIVAITWFVVSIVPENSGGFFQTVFIAAIASLFEYGIIYLDSENTIRCRVAVIGVIGSLLYLFCAFLGFSGLLLLDTTTHLFSLGKGFPVPDPSSVKWSFYWTVYIMAVFPGLVVVEFFLKPEAQTATSSA